VRVNAAGTPWHGADMAASTRAGAGAILLPKVKDAGEIIEARLLADGTPLWAMIETPRALFNALAIADAGAGCLVLGSNDMLHAMEGRHRADRANLWGAMSLCVLAARAAGIPVLTACITSWTPPRNSRRPARWRAISALTARA
jgi:citrate lyase subunit beta / citryl-CoA lyase